MAKVVFNTLTWLDRSHKSVIISTTAKVIESHLVYFERPLKEQSVGFFKTQITSSAYRVISSQSREKTHD